MSLPQEDEIYLEFQIIGQYQKLTAIDAKSHIEVSVSGPASTSREHITRLAVRKLKRRIADLENKEQQKPHGRLV